MLNIIDIIRKECLREDEISLEHTGEGGVLLTTYIDGNITTFEITDEDVRNICYYYEFNVNPMLKLENKNKIMFD